MDQLNILLAKIDALGKRGQDLDMIPIFEEAIVEIRYRKDNALLARVLNDYGGVLRNTGDYIKAERVLCEAKAIVEEYAGVNSSAYITTLLNLGTNYLDAKNYLQARSILLEAYNLANKLALKNILFASIVNNLGNVYLSLEEYDLAYKYQKQAIDILEFVEPSRVKQAISYNNMAEICRALGKIDDYESFISKAKALMYESVGEKHPLYAVVLNNIAASIARHGHTDEAIGLLETILPVLIETYGIDSKAYRLATKNLSLLQSQTNIQNKEFSNDTIESSIANSKEYPIVYDESFLISSYEKGSSFENARIFLTNAVYPILKEEFSDILHRICIGLTGKGSECLGYDDDLSKDHDYELKLLLFLTDDDYRQYHDVLEHRFVAIDTGHVYIVPISDFYRKYTGNAEGPQGLTDWQSIPEDFLVNAVSGCIFFDNLGAFTSIRKRLLGYYPEDLWKKHLAYYCIKLGQSGQYNYPRCVKRNDKVAAWLALSESIEMIISIVFVLNKRYKPFYKWQYRALLELPILGTTIANKLEKMIELDICNPEIAKILEEVCCLINTTLCNLSISHEDFDFMVDQGLFIHSTIANNVLRYESPWVKGG